jgi:hypothetical protein
LIEEHSVSHGSVDAPLTGDRAGERVITVLRRSDCAHGPEAIGSIKRLAVELGIAIHVEDVLIRTDEEAHAHRCLGSPTVLVAGQDVERAARGRSAFGVT